MNEGTMIKFILFLVTEAAQFQTNEGILESREEFLKSVAADVHTTKI
jgi:hypothetical protein